MTCFYPIPAYKNFPGSTGIAQGHPVYCEFYSEKERNKIYFCATDEKLGYCEFDDVPEEYRMLLPCGKCFGCRLDRSRMWAVRCMHEASLHDSNCFITLTFNNDFLNADRSLDKRDFQLFMMRLRKRFGAGIRFYHCGEYGAKLGRPHHHALLFNFDFEDKKLWSVRKGVRLYVSESLQKLWPFGFSTIGDVTYQSAAYCARYIMKKKFGFRAQEHYEHRIPEYNTMSRRPGIAYDWYQKFKDDIYPRDLLVVRSSSSQFLKMKPPKYYDGLYEAESPEEYKEIKDARKERFSSSFSSFQEYLDSLDSKRVILKGRLSQLIRVYEDAF